MPRKLPFRAAPAALVAAALPVGATAREADGMRYTDIPADAYAVVAQLRAKPGKEDALRAITLPLVAQVRAEPNNLLYFLQENRETPGAFHLHRDFRQSGRFRGT